MHALRRFTVPVLLVLTLLGAQLGAAAPAAAQAQGPKLTDFNSAHIDMTITVATANATITVPASGDFAVDPATKDVRLQFSMSAMGQSFNMIMLDHKLYIRTGDGGQWREVDTGQQMNRATMNMAPPQQIANLRGAVAYRQLGQATIDGTATTQWAIDINTQQLADFFMMFPGMTGGQIANPTATNQQAAEVLRTAKIDAQIWVANDTGYLKRTQINLSMMVPANRGQVSTAPAQPQELREQIVMTFSRYNEPVSIVAPANAVPLAVGPRPAAGQPPQAQMPRGQGQAPMAAGQPRPQIQMPRTAGQPPVMAGATMPVRMPRTGDLPLWPLGGLGLLLLGAGLGMRRFGRRAA